VEESQETVSRLTRPWSPRNKLKAISLGTKGFAAVTHVTQTEPRIKMRRLP
jgi:hypothetical protein